MSRRHPTPEKDRQFRPRRRRLLVADQTVDAIEQVVTDDLLDRHARAGIELRITPSIWPFWRRVASSTVEFSGSRLRNAVSHPDQFD